jgi:3-oxoacyl-[acyl-carrier protein] reductase
MARRLENKVAIITGGARGIGAAAAKALAREGSHIVLLRTFHLLLSWHLLVQ